MVFPRGDYDNSAFQRSDGQYTFSHKAFGADSFRYTWNYGLNWTDWKPWEAVTTIPGSVFTHDDRMVWDGDHIIVQCKRCWTPASRTRTLTISLHVDWSQLSSSAYQVVHADVGYNKPRRVPQFVARGPYNAWGFDQGLASSMNHRDDGKWELEIMATWPSYVQLNVYGNDDYFYGDVDGDGVMERLPPNSAAPNYFNMSAVSF